MTNEEARARLIALAQNEPKGVQRDALIMGATALIDDVNNIWLQEHDKRIRAEVINLFETNDCEGCEGCTFIDTEEWEMPCLKCKRNCKDYWRAKQKGE